MSSIHFTLVQTALHWENKKANLEMLKEKILSIPGPTHIVVLPEMFSTGFSMRPERFAEPMPAATDGDGSTITWMKNIAARKKAILTGSLIIEEDGKYFNRLIWMLPNGEMAWYDKRHLFAYAEEDKHYTAGTERLIASVNGWKINLMVCYDLRFPVWSRQSPRLQGESRPGCGLEYDILVYVANWPERRSTAWKTLLRARAIENQCYVVGVNRVGKDGNGIYHSGNSMVVDPLGEILYQKAAEEDVFTVSLDKAHLEQVREKFPFWRDTDDFQIISRKEKK